jgi:PiT family inorganic phosphate transporter
MGVITVLLVTYGSLNTFSVPLWVILACHISISLGTFFGGWRIVKTMAQKITKLRPYQGFCAETSGGLVLVLMAWLGVPVSTTHVISASIMGVGATNKLSAVRWGVARKIVGAWILTIPASAIIAGLTYAIVGMLLR